MGEADEAEEADEAGELRSTNGDAEAYDVYRYESWLANTT